MSMETLSEENKVKAKKIHICNFCSAKIQIGDFYIKSTHKNDGDIYDWKTHRWCADLAHDLNMYDEADEGLTGDAFQEYVSNFHDDLLINILPKSEGNKYEGLVSQIKYVNFQKKLWFVIRYFAKLKNQSK